MNFANIYYLQLAVHRRDSEDRSATEERQETPQSVLGMACQKTDVLKATRWSRRRRRGSGWRKRAVSRQAEEDRDCTASTTFAAEKQGNQAEFEPFTQTQESRETCALPTSHRVFIQFRSCESLCNFVFFFLL